MTREEFRKIFFNSGIYSFIGKTARPLNMSKRRRDVFKPVNGQKGIVYLG